MTDLDADLYGDLYGNDDDGFGPNTGESKPDIKAETADGSVLSSDAKASDDIKSFSAALPAPASAPANLAKLGPPITQKLPALNAPPPQAIQTYQQQSYEEPPPPRQSFAGGTPAVGGMMNSVVNVDDRGVRPSEMKDEGKMFIGGLNWDTTDEGLKEYFEQFGKVDACTIMRDAGGRSRCFAFLTFEDAASVNAVMVREHVLDGKIIDPKRAIPRTEHQRATKLFIGGLAGSVTSESMRQYFSQFGRVVDSTVMLDRETGRSKGFGFISLEDVDVNPILGFGNLEIDGKLIDIKLAQPRHQRDNFQESGQQGGNNQRANYSPTPTGAQTGMQQQTAGTPFDPQALAALYTRMFQVNGGMQGGMQGNMMAANPGMGNMGGAGMMGNGMMGAGMGGMGGMNMGAAPMMGGGPMMGGMGRGGPMGMMNRGAPMGMNGQMIGGGPMANVPRGPRGAGGPPVMPAQGVMGVGGPGPQRTGQRGQHNYHPYQR